MISVTKKYSDGKFSFLLEEDGKKKCECFFKPFSAEIETLFAEETASEEERRAAVLAVLSFLENAGKTEAFYFGKEHLSLFSSLGFKDGKLSLVGYFTGCKH